MKAATILPTRYLHIIKDRDYHMALAHLIGKDKEYTDFYTERAKDGFVMLDNGVIETGTPMPIATLVRKAGEIGANEIILPDVFKKSDETLEAIYDAMDYVQGHAPWLNVMAVPQGDAWEEWCNCAQAIIAEFPVHTIGIPKVLTQIGGRDARLNAIRQFHENLTEVDIHLLGCWSNPLELTMIEMEARKNNWTNVRGCDSAIAYVYAREGILISAAPRPTGEIHFDAQDADMDRLLRNIYIWEEACNPRPDIFTLA
jgi:hypothetical protein